MKFNVPYQQIKQFLARCVPNSQIRHLRAELGRQAVLLARVEADLKEAQLNCAQLVPLQQDNALLRAQVDELNRAKEQAEQANAHKTAFMVNIRHEIRSPMTSVLGFADLIAHSELSPEKRHSYFEKITRNAKHLLALIDEHSSDSFAGELFTKNKTVVDQLTHL